MASQLNVLGEKRSNQERRMGWMKWERRHPMSRRMGAASPWRVDIVIENDREIVASRSLLDRRSRSGRSDRRNYVERRTVTVNGDMSMDWSALWGDVSRRLQSQNPRLTKERSNPYIN